MKIQDKEISHRIYSSEFKPIRTQKDLHLGEHTLMRNTATRRRVIVKIHECASIDELHIILKDYENLNSMHLQTSNLCDFVGYYLEQTKDSKSKASVVISLIYDYHQTTLQQQINSMILKNQSFQQKELECFLGCSLRALATLQKYGLNFLNLKYSNVLVESRNTIDMVYRLFYTPYLNGSVSEIKQNRSNIDDYNLSQQQLKLINSANNFSSQNSQTSLDFNDRLRVDKQALGLMLLRMATLSQKHGIYTINDKNDLVWDLKGLQSRLEIMNKNYSKQFTKKVQYLLTSRQFWGFQNLPQFMLNTQMMSMSRIQRSADKSLFKNSRNKSPSLSSNKKYLDISASKISQGQRESRISVNHPLSMSSIARLKGQSLQNSKISQHSPSQFSTESPSKTKTVKYHQLKQQIEQQAKRHLKQPYSEPIEYQDGSSYVGGVKKDKKNGYGVCYYKQGDIYAGEWSNDLISGKGVYLFFNCDLYKGEVKQGYKEGMGKYVYANGNYYEGEWKADKKNGFGVFVNLQKGEKYEGNWTNGVRDGSGTFTWKNGDKYEGGFSQGLKSGNGIIIKNNNTKLTGQFYNDGIHGIVCIKYGSGTIYTGEVKTNPYQSKIILQGKSKQINLLNQTNYEGGYLNNSRNGNCKISYKNGDIYEGFIKDNLFEGFGKYYYEYLQCWYSGGWKQGKQHGNAKLEFSNGTVIQCDWAEGRPLDKGKILYKNGDRYEGQIGRLGRNGNGTYFTAKGDKIQGTFKNGILIHKKV